VILEGGLVRLEPLSLDHLDGLASVGLDRAIWTWMYAPITTLDEMRSWLEAALSNARSGIEVPFATIERASGQAIGSTRFMSVAMEHRRVEIGWTWIAPAWQGSGANTEAKLLLLEHAFERLGCRRVEFKTDSLNERSRAALLGIGATFEGILRNHMIMADGRQRHSAYYSVLDSEWPAVRERLAAEVRRRTSGMTSKRSMPSSTASDRADDRRTQHMEDAT
jgi:RimJ/RimL family protein N-acetyltransferase